MVFRLILYYSLFNNIFFININGRKKVKIIIDKARKKKLSTLPNSQVYLCILLPIFFILKYSKKVIDTQEVRSCIDMYKK